MSKKQDEVIEAHGLEDIGALFPPSSASEAVLLVAKVSMKLPVFWPVAAKVWFAQADTQFAIRSVTVSKAKLYHGVAVLPQEVASQNLILIRTPPTGDPYGVLRERLITLYMLNDYQPLEAQVSLPLSGDQKPSHLMNRMLALLPDDYKLDFILRGLFLRCLPLDVRSHLLHKKVSDPRALPESSFFFLAEPPLQRPAGEPSFLPCIEVSSPCEVSSLQAFSNPRSYVQISYSVWTLLVPQEAW